MKLEDAIETASYLCRILSIVTASRYYGPGVAPPYEEFKLYHVKCSNVSNIPDCTIIVT